MRRVQVLNNKLFVDRLELVQVLDELLGGHIARDEITSGLWAIVVAAFTRRRVFLLDLLRLARHCALIYIMEYVEGKGVVGKWGV